MSGTDGDPEDAKAKGAGAVRTATCVLPNPIECTASHVPSVRFCTENSVGGLSSELENGKITAIERFDEEKVDIAVRAMSNTSSPYTTATSPIGMISLGKC